jgi:hypothetical protein
MENITLAHWDNAVLGRKYAGGGPVMFSNL